MASEHSEQGIVTLKSKHSVDETVTRLQQMLAAKAVKVFAIVDHSGEAEKAGSSMPNTKLVIFGSPKAGTPIMIAAPTTAIDLPLKLLIREDASGKVWISYNDPAFLKARHDIPADLLQALGAAGALASNLAE